MTYSMITQEIPIPPPPGQGDYIDAEYRIIDDPDIPTEKADQIETPRYTRQLAFHEGGVYKFRGYMEKRKTSVMICFAFELKEHHGYHGNEFFSNTWIDMPGLHYLSNDEFKKVCRRAFNTEVGSGRWNHTVFLAMAADILWSHVTQADKECYEDLKGISESYKRNVHFAYEIHQGRAVPKYLRDMTEISVRPEPRPRDDGVDLIVANGHYGYNCIVPLKNVSWVNNKYRRFLESY